MSSEALERLAAWWNANTDTFIEDTHAMDAEVTDLTPAEWRERKVDAERGRKVKKGATGRTREFDVDVLVSLFRRIRAQFSKEKRSNRWVCERVAQSFQADEKRKAPSVSTIWRYCRAVLEPLGEW